MFGVSLNFVKKVITKKVPKKAINFFPKTFGHPVDTHLNEQTFVNDLKKLAPLSLVARASYY